MKIVIDLPEIEGFEYTGEYRKIKNGDWFLNEDLKPIRSSCTGDVFPILKPVEKWIVPTLEYMQENYKWGEGAEARVRDYSNDVWRDDSLYAISERSGLTFLYLCHNERWKYCEIKVKP
jgi:hypothetical protein